MKEKSVFVFKGYTFDSQSGQVIFRYELRRGEEVLSFSEKLILPNVGMTTNVPAALLKLVLDNLLLALGISYYKLYCPKEIQIEGFSLSEEQANFWNTFYTKGLGEFFYQNKVDFRDLVRFPFEKLVVGIPVAFVRKNRSLVGIGGGKDSIVAGELLKEKRKEFHAFVVNDHDIKRQTIALLGVESITIKREVDPKLLELNRRKDSYNGHVPFSGILAFLGLLMALLYDYTYIIVANEQSASFGNVEYLGTIVNHQWSKSLEFEELFQDYVRSFITPDIVYFSLLRSLSELAIAKKFVRYPQYFPVFSSCNRNFLMKGRDGVSLWCGECAKCAFTFVMLAAFLPKETVVSIFGENLFAKEHLLETYQHLLGIKEIKPFDCVGTPEEVKVAFSLSAQRGEYIDDIIMQYFEKEVLPYIGNIERLKMAALAMSEEQRIPVEFKF